jgi:hypothetical protein
MKWSKDHVLTWGFERLFVDVNLDRLTVKKEHFLRTILT